jgi:hypothetical protein
MMDNNANNDNPELAGIQALIDSKFQLLQDRLKNVPTVVLYQPGNIAKENRFIMLVRVEIEYALQQLVESYSENALSSILAIGYEKSLSDLENNGLIEEELAQDIRDFYTLSTPFIRKPITGNIYLQIQYIASDILERLLQIPLGPHF